MRVTDEHISMLRAYLDGDSERFNQLSAVHAQSPGWSSLITAAFFIAIDQTLSTDTSRSDVVLFVADLRAMHPVVAEHLDPDVAERMIWGVLTGEPAGEVDTDTSFGTQFLVTRALIGTGKLSSTQLDEFAQEARRLAEVLLDDHS